MAILFASVSRGIRQAWMPALPGCAPRMRRRLAFPRLNSKIKLTERLVKKSGRRPPMAVNILIPTALRNYAGGSDSVSVEARTVGEALDALTNKLPDLKKHLYGVEGQLRHFVNIYLNDEDIRYAEKGATPIKDGDALSIVPSIAGG